MTRGFRRENTKVGPSNETRFKNLVKIRLGPSMHMSIHTCGESQVSLPNLTSIGFTNFFRYFIFELFFFTNADVVTIKDETSKENS